MISLQKEEIPGQRDTKSSIGKFEENARPEVVNTKDAKAALKFETIEEGEEEIDVSTCMDDLQLEVLSDYSKPTIVDTGVKNRSLSTFPLVSETKAEKRGYSVKRDEIENTLPERKVDPGIPYNPLEEGIDFIQWRRTPLSSPPFEETSGQAVASQIPTSASAHELPGPTKLQVDSPEVELVSPPIQGGNDFNNFVRLPLGSSTGDSIPLRGLNAHTHDAPLAHTSLDRSGGPQAKRRRIVMDSVLVPTLSSLRQREKLAVKLEPNEVPWVYVKPEPLSGEDQVKLEFFRSNPNFATKKEALDDAGMVYRFRALGPNGMDPYPINVEGDIKWSTVTREWMSKTYGGNPQAGCPRIDRKKFKHGLKDITFMTPDFNPNAPSVPGTPGLSFGFWGGAGERFTIRAIVRTHKPKGLPPQWLYLGQYDSIPTYPLTKDEWNTQSFSFQNHWANEINANGWGLYPRVRIGLRYDLGREPTDDEVDVAYDSGQYRYVPTDIIKEAFVQGHEELDVWCMKCVGYDTAFQRVLATMPPDYNPPKEPKQKGKGKTVTKAKTKTSTRKVKTEQEEPDLKPTKSKKRKQQAVESSDEGSDSKSKERHWASGSTHKTRAQHLSPEI